MVWFKEQAYLFWHSRLLADFLSKGAGTVNQKQQGAEDINFNGQSGNWRLKNKFFYRKFIAIPIQCFNKSYLPGCTTSPTR
jgi:hypothetical protein